MAEAEDRMSRRGAWIRGGPYIRCWWCLARHENARKPVRKRDVCVCVCVWWHGPSQAMWAPVKWYLSHATLMIIS